jgi:hypothetical protein
MLAYGLPQLSVDPVLYLPLWRGTLRDQAGHSISQSGGRWSNSGARAGYEASQIGDKLWVPTHADFTLTDLTLFVSGHWRRWTGTRGRFISQRDGAATAGYDFFAQSESVFFLYDGVTSSVFALSKDWTGTGSIAVTASNGATPVAYLDGAFNAFGSADLSSLDYLGPVYLGNQWTGDAQLHGAIETALIYPAVLSAAEISALHDWSQSVGTPHRQWPGAGLHLPGGVLSGDPYYVDSIQYARVTLASVTAGSLSNTGLTVQTGTWAVGEDGTGRYLECVADGQITESVIGASGADTAEFAYTGTASLTKTATEIQIDATAGAKIRAVRLTAA